MLSALIKAIRTTTSARLSALYTVLLASAFMLAGALIWWVSLSATHNELRDRIRLEMHAMRLEAEEEGLALAAKAIAARAEQPGSLEYWLTDSNGKVLAGDLPIMQVADGWAHLELAPRTPGAEDREQLLVFATTLPDGSRLAIGDTPNQGERVRETILSTMFWIGASTLIVGLTIGIGATRQLLSRMDSLTTVIGRVTAGDLSARATAPTSDRLDDIDRLGLGINTMLERIAALVVGVRRVSSDVAHELRTPLSHLQQKLEEARAASPVDRDLALEAAQEKVHDVLRIFDALLRLGEIEAGAARTRFTEVSLPALLELLVDAYRPDIEASGRRIECDRLDPATILGDRDLLAQAIANLIENSLRYCPPGALIELQVRADESAVQIQVADNGPGIPAAERDRLLAPFTRLEGSRSTAGAGLGLSIVAAIAKLHGAELVLGDTDPALGVGLNVTLHFRRSTPSASA